VKQYRVISLPTYGHSATPVYLDTHPHLSVGSVVYVDESLGTDEDGDVRAYATDAGGDTWMHVNVRHLASTDGPDRAGRIREAREILGDHASARDLIAMAEYLGGQA
jgi:hypothetical protein